MQLIQHQELAGTQASIQFLSIPQTFTDLVVVLSGRTNRASNNSDIYWQFNGVTTSTYSFRRLYGDGTSATSDALSNNSAGGFIGVAVGANATSNTFSNLTAYIPNYTSSNAKSWSADAVNENNATATLGEIVAGLWSGTAAITSIEIKDYNAASFVQFTSATLYGITRGSDGIVTVS
jgi:hypothetical protein